MSRIKFATIDTPTFREAGLALSERWTEIDLDAATPEQLDMLEQTLGQIVQVHPDDLDAYSKAIGAEIRDGKVIGENIGDRHQAKTAVERATKIAQEDHKAAQAALEKAKKSLAHAESLSNRPNARVTGTPTTKNPPATVPTEIDRTDEEVGAPRNPQPVTDVPEMHADATSTPRSPTKKK